MIATNITPALCAKATFWTHSVLVIFSGDKETLEVGRCNTIYSSSPVAQDGKIYVDFGQIQYLRPRGSKTKLMSSEYFPISWQRAGLADSENYSIGSQDTQ